MVKTATLEHATDYTDVFADANEIDRVFKLLAREVHPDRSGDDVLFVKLKRFRDEARQMVAEGRFGEQVRLAVIRTKRHVHTVHNRIGDDDMAIYYRVTEEDGVTGMLKVAKSAKDNDMMAQEAKALKLLHAKDDTLVRHYPLLYDTFVHSEGRKRANVTTLFEWCHSLETVRARFPAGVDPRHGVWMFRRLLMALGYAHDQGLVHGAVTPDNVLVGADDHAVVLIDWCYSLVIDDKSKTNFIKAVVPMYKSLYAPEVFEKKPASAATDLYMAATLMSWLMPVAPKPFRAFFKGIALTKPSMRPQNAWELLKEFDDLLERIGEPFHPRRFVEFAVPSGAA